MALKTLEAITLAGFMLLLIVLVAVIIFWPLLFWVISNAMGFSLGAEIAIVVQAVWIIVVVLGRRSDA